MAEQPSPDLYEQGHGYAVNTQFAQTCNRFLEYLDLAGTEARYIRNMPPFYLGRWALEVLGGFTMEPVPLPAKGHERMAEMRNSVFGMRMSGDKAMSHFSSGLLAHRILSPRREGWPQGRTQSIWNAGVVMAGYCLSLYRAMGQDAWAQKLAPPNDSFITLRPRGQEVAVCVQDHTKPIHLIQGPLRKVALWGTSAAEAPLLGHLRDQATQTAIGNSGPHGGFRTTWYEYQCSMTDDRRPVLEPFSVASQLGKVLRIRQDPAPEHLIDTAVIRSIPRHHQPTDTRVLATAVNYLRPGGTLVVGGSVSELDEFWPRAEHITSDLNIQLYQSFVGQEKAGQSAPRRKVLVATKGV